MQAKRKYKDSVFRHMFNDKQRLQSLYKALSGRYVPLSEITINTLHGGQSHGDSLRTPEQLESEYAVAHVMVFGETLSEDGG